MWVTNNINNKLMKQETITNYFVIVFYLLKT